jgi:cardiolipin synthase
MLSSHTTAVLARPGSSLVELGYRFWNQGWDLGRRLEIRMVRFPMLGMAPVPPLEASPDSMDLTEWELRLDQLCGENRTSARIDFLIDGEAFYSALEQAVVEAEWSIDLQTYLFDNDDVARSIADRLRERSKEIEVRVMYDGLGTYMSHTAYAESQPANTDFIDNMPRYLCRDSNVQLRVIPNIWLTGDHCKTFIFDRRTAFIGGMNIGREYRYDWHDIMVRLEGPAVQYLWLNFESTWRRSGWSGDLSVILPRPQPDAFDGQSDEIPLRFLHTLPYHAQIYRTQLEAIQRAKNYIYIENAYFADDLILYELCRARRRGVDVRVILPAAVNHKFMEHSNRVGINTLLEHGVRVYLYPHMSHVKAAVYDGWACLGTANFNKLSLQINREINVATSDRGTVDRLLEELFLPDLEKSREITEPVSLNLKDHLIELIADET